MRGATNKMMQAYDLMMRGEHVQAMAMFQRLLAEGYDEANFYLGYMYENGWGVAVDTTMAQKFYQTMCETNPLLGKRSLAKLYVEQQDFQAAVAIYVELADGGDISAAYWAYTLFNIELKSPVNQIKAEEYLQKAVNGGHLFAKRDFYVRQSKQNISIVKRIWLKLKIFWLKPQCICLLSWNLKDSRVR